jgi:hypothetical protein
MEWEKGGGYRRTFSQHPSRRMLKQAVSKAAADTLTKGVDGMVPTARVQRGSSETARCASKGIVPSTPPTVSAFC